MSGQDLDSMDLESFGRWDVNALKNYLRKRDLKTSGSKAILMARAFCAWEQKVTVVPDNEERERERAAVYHSLLVTDDEGVLPDPFCEIDAWKGEEDGMSLWPPIMLTDISDYLRKHETHMDTASLRRRLLKDYKEQKAYSYFSSQWLFEIRFTAVSERYRFLTALCRPSQRIHNPPHELWVCASNEGEVISAYCSCFAGLGQSCNHVAALLLKVDFCWRYGLINKTCTSKPCVWVHPSKGKSVEPKKLSDMKWKKPGALRLDQKKTINSEVRKTFQPLSETKDKGMSLSDFLERLSIVSPKSVIPAEQKMKDPPHAERKAQNCFEPVHTEPLPPSVSAVAAGSISVDCLLKNLSPLPAESIKQVERETRAQSQSEVWFDQRDGSLTASNFHDIFTRVEAVKKNAVTDLTSLTKKICSYKKAPSEMPALKYGRRMEPDALKSYAEYLKRTGHKNVACIPCGLFVHPEYSYLRATPDALVKCSCCGDGLVEVKCPLSSCHLKPTPDSVDYLVLHAENHVQLKRSHKYFDQIVGQIMVTGHRYCDFFVFTMHGFHVERIFVEEAEERWGVLKENLDYYFVEFLAPELVNRTIKNSIMEADLIDTQQIQPQPVQPSTSYNFSTRPSIKTKPPNILQKRQTKKRKRTTKIEGKPSYVCFICDGLCKEIDDENAVPSIMCDTCHAWLHWPCAGVSNNSAVVLDENQPFMCMLCIAEDKLVFPK